MNVTKVPRVLVVDDSAASRALLAEVLEDAGCEVVGRAMDGAMALRLVADLKPDAITCDLEMPGMDGFTFLRLLTANFPTPVIMVTSNAKPEAALQSLELGARDFVVKPSRSATGMRLIANEVAEKIHALVSSTTHVPMVAEPPKAVISTPTQRISLLAIGASTGGPRAIRTLLGAIHQVSHPPIVIAQHMPSGFTEAFANRLAASTGEKVAEARDGEVLRPGSVRVAPGGMHLEVAPSGRRFMTHLKAGDSSERHVPSVDRLLCSAAAAAGNRVLGIVLTGMGRDGAEGAVALHQAGAPLWTEAADSATIFGMPHAAAEGHPTAQMFSLDTICHELRELFKAK